MKHLGGDMLGVDRFLWTMLGGELYAQYSHVSQGKVFST